ncbi:MAG: sugar ABC transporter permease [Eubacteriales bacterium]|nr:sugar ABC transporter permease [Eubacteriales bacterium]
MKKKLDRTFKTDVLLSLPALVAYLLLFVTPVLIGIWYSFTDWNGISRNYDFIGLKNYAKLFMDQRFLRVIGFTLRYTGYLIMGVLLVSLLTALVLNAKPKGWSFFKAVFFLPCLFSLVTTGLLFKEIYSEALPLLGQAVGSELLSRSLLSNSSYAIYAVLLVNLWSSVAIPTVLIFAALKSVPKDLYEVADIDGGSGWDKFKAITVPYLIPTLNMVFVTTLKGGLCTYEYITVLTAGGPGRATESLAYIIYIKGFNENAYAYASAMSVVMFLAMVFVSFIYFRLVNRKEVVA